MVDLKKQMLLIKRVFFKVIWPKFVICKITYFYSNNI